MIRIIEGQLKEVERKANELIDKGWRILGPALYVGVNPSTHGSMVMITLESKAAQLTKEPDWNTLAYTLNSAGCCDE